MIASSLGSTSDSLFTMGFGVKSSSHTRLSLSAHTANEVIFPIPPYGTQLGQSDYSKLLYRIVLVAIKTPKGPGTE